MRGWFLGGAWERCWGQYWCLQWHVMHKVIIASREEFGRYSGIFLVLVLLVCSLDNFAMLAGEKRGRKSLLQAS